MLSEHRLAFTVPTPDASLQAEDTREAKRSAGKLNGDVRPKINMLGCSSKIQDVEQPHISIQPTNPIEVPTSKSAGPSNDGITPNQLTKHNSQAKANFPLQQSTDNIRPKSSAKPIRKNVSQRPVVSDAAALTAVHDTLSSPPASSTINSTANPPTSVRNAETNNPIKSTESTATIDVNISKDTGPLYDSASRRFLR